MPIPAPRPRRRVALDVRLVLGLLLVAASVAGTVLLVGAADARIRVYAAPQALAPGDRVDAGDLVERSVALDGAEDLYLRVGDVPDGGFVVAQPVGAGQLVPRASAGSADGARATSIVLSLAGPVSGVVGPGSLVDVWGVPVLGQGEPGAPVVLVPGATVVRVLEDDALVSAAGAATSVEVLVPRTRVARLLRAITGGDALAVVPAALPLASR